MEYIKKEDYFSDKPSPGDHYNYPTIDHIHRSHVYKKYDLHPFPMGRVPGVEGAVIVTRVVTDIDESLVLTSTLSMTIAVFPGGAENEQHLDLDETRVLAHQKVSGYDKQAAKAQHETAVANLSKLWSGKNV